MHIDDLINKAKELTKHHDNVVFEGYLYRLTGSMKETYLHHFRFLGLWSTVDYHAEVCFDDLEIQTQLKTADKIPPHFEERFIRAIDYLIRQKEKAK